MIDIISIKAMFDGLTATYLLEDNTHAFYYCKTPYGIANFKIPLFEAEMVYPGIPANLLIKYLI